MLLWRSRGCCNLFRAHAFFSGAWQGRVLWQDYFQRIYVLSLSDCFWRTFGDFLISYFALGSSRIKLVTKQLILLVESHGDFGFSELFEIWSELDTVTKFQFILLTAKAGVGRFLKLKLRKLSQSEVIERCCSCVGPLKILAMSKHSLSCRLSNARWRAEIIGYFLGLGLS